MTTIFIEPLAVTKFDTLSDIEHTYRSFAGIGGAFKAVGNLVKVGAKVGGSAGRSAAKKIKNTAGKVKTGVQVGGKKITNAAKPTASTIGNMGLLAAGGIATAADLAYINEVIESKNEENNAGDDEDKPNETPESDMNLALLILLGCVVFVGVGYVVFTVIARSPKSPTHNQAHKIFVTNGLKNQDIRMHTLPYE